MTARLYGGRAHPKFLLAGITTHRHNESVATDSVWSRRESHQLPTVPLEWIYVQKSWCDLGGHGASLNTSICIVAECANDERSESILLGGDAISSGGATAGRTRDGCNGRTIPASDLLHGCRFRRFVADHGRG